MCDNQLGKNEREEEEKEKEEGKGGAEFVRLLNRRIPADSLRSQSSCGDNHPRFAE
jgi:hypothetical protein